MYPNDTTRGLHAGVGVVLAEQARRCGRELVDVERRGVDDDVGLGLHRLEQLPLALDGVGQALAGRRAAGGGGGCSRSGGRAPRWRPRGRGCRTRAPDGPQRAEARQRGRRGGRRRPTTSATRGRGRARRPHQLDDLRDELGGQVVDHEPAEVLEVVGGLRPARARQPRDDDELAHGAAQATAPGSRPACGSGRNSSRGMVAAAGVLRGPGEEAGRRGRLLHAARAAGRCRPAR